MDGISVCGTEDLLKNSYWLLNCYKQLASLVCRGIVLYFVSHTEHSLSWGNKLLLSQGVTVFRAERVLLWLLGITVNSRCSLTMLHFYLN